MSTEIQIAKARDPTRAAKELMTSLPAFSGYCIDDQEELANVRRAINLLTKKEDDCEKLICGEITTILHNPAYFSRDFHPDVLDRMLEQWLKELEPFPYWVVRQACEYWISRENEKRRKVPIAGDIGERCHSIMTPVRQAQKMCGVFEEHGTAAPHYYPRKSKQKSV